MLLGEHIVGFQRSLTLNALTPLERLGEEGTVGAFREGETRAER
jgi:hypothetical protein